MRRGIESRRSSPARRAGVPGMAGVSAAIRFVVTDSRSNRVGRDSVPIGLLFQREPPALLLPGTTY